MNPVPIACTLSTAELRCSADRLLPGLARVARSVTRTPDGARLEFHAADGIVERIASVIESERRCCQFLHFVLEVPNGGEPIGLTIDGPPGTGAFLVSLGPEFVGA